MRANTFFIKAIIALLIIVTCVLSIVKSSKNTVNWSTLTASQLNQLSDDVFSRVNAQQIALIPANACSGFKSSQLASINGYECGGFTSTCFSNMNSNTFTGLSYECINSVQPYVIAAGINTPQKLGNIPTNTIGSFTSQNLVKLNASVCSGFTTNQIASLSVGSVCDGFQFNCFSQLTPQSVTQMTGQCLQHLKIVDMLNRLQNDKLISSINPKAFASLTSNQLSGITSQSVCSSLTADQIRNLNSQLTDYTCQGFQPSCLAALPPTSYAGFTANCINTLYPGNLQNGIVSADQIAQISPAAFSGWKKLQISQFNSIICSGISSAQIAALQSDKICSGFKAGCLKNIPSGSFSGMSKSCLNELAVDQVTEGISSTQIAQILPLAFSGFTSDLLSALNPDSCSGIQSNQLLALDNNYPSLACKGFTASCLSNIPTITFTKMTAKCLAQLSQAAIGLQASQIENIPPESFSGFTSSALSSLNAKACSGMNSKQVYNFDCSYPQCPCTGFKSVCLNNIPPDTFSGFKAECFSKISANEMIGITSSQFSKIDPMEMVGFSNQQLKNLNPATCSGISAEQIKRLDTLNPSNACKGLLKSCLANIPANTYSGLQLTCINQIESSETSGISAIQISQISPAAFKGFTYNQVKSFVPEVCSGFTAYQQFDTTVPNYACRGLSKSCISKITTKSITAFTAECVNEIGDSEISGLLKSQLAVMTVSSMNGFSKGQIANLNAETCGGFSAQQVKLLNSNACQGFKEGCLSNIQTEASSVLGSKCFSKIPVESIKGFRKGAIPSFSTDTFSGITYPQIREFFNIFGDADFVSVITFDQSRGVSPDQILAWKRNIETGQVNRYRDVRIATDLSTITWLQLSLSTRASIISKLNPSNVVNLGPQTFMGLLNESQFYSPQFYSQLPVSKLGNILMDTMETITKEQVSQINPAAFLAESGQPFVYTLQYLSPKAIPGLTTEQLQNFMKADVLGNVMSCPQYNALTANQLNVIKGSNSQHNILKRCRLSNKVSTSAREHGDSHDVVINPIIPSSVSNSKASNSVNHMINVIVLVITTTLLFPL